MPNIHDRTKTLGLRLLVCSSLSLCLGPVSGCSDPDSDDDALGSTDTDAGGDTDAFGDETLGDEGSTGGKDPTGDDDSTGDDDPTDDGDPTDDDDDPEPLPDGLIAQIDDLRGDLVLGPDHAFVIQHVGHPEDAHVLRIDKGDASIETHVTISAPFNAVNGSSDALYGVTASQVRRGAFDTPGSMSTIATIGGTGLLDRFTLTDDHVFTVHVGATYRVHRMAHDGADLTMLLSSEGSLTVQANTTRLFGRVESNLVEIDTETGELELRHESVNSFHVGESALFFRRSGALWRLPLEGGDPLEIVGDEDIGGNTSPFGYASDDTHLYWSTDNVVDQNSVRRVPIDGGDVEILWSVPASRRASGLGLDEAHAYWVARGGDEPGLWRLTK
jgi:hypothetical protein